MRMAAIFCSLAASLCEVVANWGTQTGAGQHAFDEMAGIVRAAAFLLGIVLVAVATLTWWLSGRMSVRTQR